MDHTLIIDKCNTYWCVPITFDYIIKLYDPPNADLFNVYKSTKADQNSNLVHRLMLSKSIE